jgi:hypothetical protein
MNVTAKSLFPGLDGLGRSLCDDVRLQDALLRDSTAADRTVTETTVTDYKAQRDVYGRFRPTDPPILLNTRE